MNPLDDATLRDLLERRVRSGPLQKDETDQILSAVAAGRAAPRRPNVWTLSGPAWLGFAAAALSLILVVAVVGKPPNNQGPISSVPPGSSASSAPPATSVAPTQQPISERVFSAQELSDMIGAEHVGDVVLAHVRIDHMGTDPKRCPPPEPCDDAVLADVSGHNAVAIGWRIANEGEGTRYGDDAGVRWLTRVRPPAEPGLFAFRILPDAAEYLGPVVATADGEIAWNVSDIQGGQHAAPSDDLYAVEGWLVATSPAPCRPPHDAPPGADTGYWCGRSWLTQQPTYTVSADRSAFSFTLDGLHAQWDAYDEFAEAPFVDGPRGSEPRFGTYLVRSVGCPPVVMGDCPVWSMVGRLGDLMPPVAAGDFPSEIFGERVLTTDEALVHVASSESAGAFLVGGWVTAVDVDCELDPNLPVTPLLEQCDGGYRMAKGPSGVWGEFRLVVHDVSIPSRQPIVLRVHAYDPRAAECPENYRARCEAAIVVEQIVWTPTTATPSPPPNEPMPTHPPRSDAILTADQLAELALDPIPVGRVLLARASFDLSVPQPADVRCVDPFCSIGLLNASAANVPVFVNSGSPTPNMSEVQAFLLLGDALEYVGPVAVPTGTANVAWSVEKILSLPPMESEFLFPVEGWLVEAVNVHQCPEPPDGSTDVYYAYWCAGAWLSSEPVYLDPRTSDPQQVVPGALHLQHGAYESFAVLANTQAPGGADPRFDTYLVRQASCPEVRIGECPVWEMVASLDAEAAPDDGARADCLSYFTIADSISISSQQLAQIADAIVVGTLTSLGPGFWISPDGGKPGRFGARENAHLVTALDIEASQTLKGAMPDGAVKLGGTHGCDTASYSPGVELTEGSRYVFFVLDGQWSQPGLNPSLVTEAWPVLSDGRVVDPRTEGVLLTLEELGPYLLGP